MRLALLLCVTAFTVACADDAPGDDDDASPIDATIADGGPDGAPDAMVRCPGEVFFTGDYVDWDSTTMMFMGVPMAIATELADPENTDESSPNGRVELCLPATGPSVVEFTHGDYLTLLYTADPDATAAGPFSIRGLTPERADELFTSLLLTRDVGAAQVIVAVRSYPGGDPVIGAQVALGNASAGAFTPDNAGDYVAGDTTTDDAFVLFANTEPTGDATTVTVTPPDGTTCVGPGSIDLAAGQLAVTTFACE